MIFPNTFPDRKNPEQINQQYRVLITTTRAPQIAANLFKQRLIIHVLGTFTFIGYKSKPY